MKFIEKYKQSWQLEKYAYSLLFNNKKLFLTFPFYIFGISALINIGLIDAQLNNKKKSIWAELKKSLRKLLAIIFLNLTFLSIYYWAGLFEKLLDNTVVTYALSLPLYLSILFVNQVVYYDKTKHPIIITMKSYNILNFIYKTSQFHKLFYCSSIFFINCLISLFMLIIDSNLAIVYFFLSALINSKISLYVKTLLYCYANKQEIDSKFERFFIS